MKRELTTITRSEDLIAFWSANQETIGALRRSHPRLLNENGRHYAELLSELYTQRLQDFAAEKERSTQALVDAVPPPKPIQRVTKPTEPHPVRRRAPDHLAYVASLPCIVCGRSPAHAHHIRHAQPRAMGRKVSDEFTIPLCATHHRALHDRGDKAAWWAEKKIDPLKEAQAIWAKGGNGIA